MSDLLNPDDPRWGQMRSAAFNLDVRPPRYQAAALVGMLAAGFVLAACLLALMVG